ncbi:MAG: DUF3592 domain-containing protein [Pseudomonadota bacterium]
MTSSREKPPGVFRLFLRMGGWIVLGLGLLVFVLSFASQGELNKAELFDAEGKATIATVTDKFTKTRYRGEGRSTTDYYLTLEYATREGGQIELKKSVSSRQYRETRAGDELNIWYLPSNPKTIELERGSSRSGSETIKWLALVFGVGWLVLLRRVGGWAVAAVRARRYGELQEVEVVEVRETNVRVNKQPRYRLIWRMPTGEEGQSLLHKRRDLEGYRSGDRIKVYTGLKYSWWVGDVGTVEDP